MHSTCAYAVHLCATSTRLPRELLTRVLNLALAMGCVQELKVHLVMHRMGVNNAGKHTTDGRDRGLALSSCIFMLKHVMFQSFMTTLFAQKFNVKNFAFSSKSD